MIFCHLLLALALAALFLLLAPLLIDLEELPSGPGEALDGPLHGQG